MNIRFLITFFLISLFIYGDSKNIKSLEYQYKLKKFDAVRVYFDCSIGNLKIRPSNNRYYIDGKIIYNADMPEPKLKFSDKNNIVIWHKEKNKINKVAAIGVRVSKWIAYHGFAINIDNTLEQYKKIIPCGISDKGVTNLKKINDQDYSDLENILIKHFILNLKT